MDALTIIAYPVFTALLLGWVSRQARALEETSLTRSKPGFGVVAAMALVLFAELLWNFFFIVSGGDLHEMFLPAIPIALFVAFDTLKDLLRWRGNMQAHPKDASPFDTGQP